jgi:hypothetical protein
VLKNERTGATVYTPPQDHAELVRLMMNPEQVINLVVYLHGILQKKKGSGCLPSPYLIWWARLGSNQRPLP